MEECLVDRNKQPIGVFDSGVGGLTVVNKLRMLLPHENIIYVGDTKRNPYGSRTPAEIVSYTRDILQYMTAQGVKLVAIGCNTVTAVAYDIVRPEVAYPLIGMSRGIATAREITTTKKIAVFATELAARGYDGQQICDILNREADHNQIYIGLDTLKYLKKGGRITPMAAAIGTLLHIKPVLGITNGGKLDSYTKVRTTRQVKEAIIKGLKSELEGRLQDPEMKNCYVAVAYTDNPEQAADFAEELKAAFPNRLDPEIVVRPLSLLISCHIGQDGLGAAVIERPVELAEA